MRLPREWLGPREELVPVAVDDERIDQLASPPSTHDFWGEALGDERTSPDDEAPSASRRAPNRRRGVTHARAISVPRFFRRSLNRTAPIVSARHAPRPGGLTPRNWRGSARVAVAAVVTVIGVAVSTGGPTGKPIHSARGTHASVTANASAAVAGPGRVFAGSVSRLRARPSALRARPSSLRTRPPSHRAHPSPRRAISTRRTDRPARPRAAHPVRPRTQATTVEPVRYTAPASTTTPSSSSAAPPVTAPVTRPVAAATRPSAGFHQPATGASGALGPGSSPDG